MKVTIVLRTKNEIKNISNFYLSIKQQTYSNIEFIVIDNFSTDGTYEFCLENCIKVWQKGPERIAQGNFGMLEKATGDLIGYFDADMILSPSVVECAVLMFIKNPACVGVYIPEIIIGQSFWTKIRRFERSFYNGTVIDAVRVIKAKALKEVKGFDEINFPSPSAEDWDLDKRLKALGTLELMEEFSKTPLNWNKKLYESLNIYLDKNDYNKNAFFHNESKFSLVWYLSKKNYYSSTIVNYVKKWGRDDPDVKKQLGLFYRYFFVFIENGKWRKFIKNLHLVFFMYFVLFLVGLVFIKKKFSRAHN